MCIRRRPLRGCFTRCGEENNEGPEIISVKEIEIEERRGKGGERRGEKAKRFARSRVHRLPPGV